MTWKLLHAWVVKFQTGPLNAKGTDVAIEELTLAYKLFLNIGEPKRSAFDAREPGTGSVAEIRGDIGRLFDIGFRKIIVRYRGNNAMELGSQIDRFVTEIAAEV